MAISFAGLTGPSVRSIVMSLIPKFLKLGWSRNYALTYLRKFGPVYRRRIYLKDWAQILGMKQKEDPLKYIRKDYFPTPDVITLTEHKQRQRFKFIYRAYGIDKDTGEKVEYPIAFGSASLHIMRTLDETARVLATSVKCGEKLVMEKVEPIAILEKTVTEKVGASDTWTFVT